MGRLRQKAAMFVSKSVIVSLLVLVFAHPAVAECDPSISCSICILRNPMGGCLQQGSDPLCEARKSACRVELDAARASTAPAGDMAKVLELNATRTGAASPGEDSRGHPLSTYREDFLRYDYAETKDMAKSFLTLVSALLVFSLTFSEKVIGFPDAGGFPRMCLIASWALFIMAIILCGVSLCFISLAGGNALYEGDYLPLALRSWVCLLIAGSFFAIGLIILIIAAAASMAKSLPKEKHIPYSERRIITTRRSKT